MLHNKAWLPKAALLAPVVLARRAEAPVAVLALPVTLFAKA